jgi:kynurenine formamidase
VIDAPFLDLAAKVNNWGRWGPEDERGTLNLLSAAAIREAAAGVTLGLAIPLSIPLSESGPQLGFIPGRVNPQRSMIALHEPMGDPLGVRFNDDAVTLGLQAATHWDALAHVTYQDRLYNGFPPSVVDSAGAARLGADKLGAITGRGVLLDLAGAAGVERLPGGHALTAADLDRAEAFGRVRVGEGDIVLLRTGQMQLFRSGDRMAYAISTAGPSLQTVRWFHDRAVAAVATDNLSFEVFPGERDDLMLPVHMLHIVEMGLVQGQNFDLEALCEVCRQEGRFSFLLEATPEPFAAACGAPVAPVAIF